MRNLYILIMLLTITMVNKSSAQKLTFGYDAAGNQIVRQWVCVNCPPGVAALPSIKEGAPMLEKEKDMIKESQSAKFRILSASPNPVEEALKVSWENSDSTFVKKIEVFSMNGTKVLEQSFSLRENEYYFSFRDLPPGLYLMLAIYNDQKKQTVKIIKK